MTIWQVNFLKMRQSLNVILPLLIVSYSDGSYRIIPSLGLYGPETSVHSPTRIPLGKIFFRKWGIAQIWIILNWIFLNWLVNNAIYFEIVFFIYPNDSGGFRLTFQLYVSFVYTEYGNTESKHYNRPTKPQPIWTRTEM